MTSSSAPPSALRIAAVQHGDYLAVRERLASGGPETYGSQRYSVEALDAILSRYPHLVISLDGPASCREVGTGRYLTIPAVRARWLPRRFAAQWRCHQVLSELKAFQPTHLLLRTNDILGCRLLAWSAKRALPTAAILASRFDPDHPPSRAFCALANGAHVMFVGNHNQVATQSLIACGLSADKAIAWDFPPRVSPSTLPVKSMDTNTPLHVVFAGNMIEGKGGQDVVAAVASLRQRGLPVCLTTYGEGPIRPSLQSHPGVAEGWLAVPGQISIESLQEAMREAWLVVVPTRPDFPEALPLTLVDALASRTPVILSDHPVFQQYFTPGQGVDFFPAGQPEALATAIAALAGDPLRYQQYSERTRTVWEGLQIPTRFHDLLARFEETACGARQAA